jgi:hypothetical protein
MVSLSYRLIYGRDPNNWDIIKKVYHVFKTENEVIEWISKNFLEKSIFWIDYTVTKDGVILFTANNVNLYFNGSNYRENR